METLFNGYTLKFAPGTFPLSTDSMVLADFVKLPKNARVLDLGSGCGTLGLMLCARDSGCTVTGIEINENAHAMALCNIEDNGLSSRLSSVCGDLRNMPVEIFDVCVSNPPYFSGGPASRENTIARREDACTLQELIGTAAKNVKFGGDFYLVHRPERLAEICTLCSNAGMEPKRLRFVRHSPDAPISLIALQCRKGGKPGITIDEISLYDASGAPTEAYRAIYHIQED